MLATQLKQKLIPAAFDNNNWSKLLANKPIQEMQKRNFAATEIIKHRTVFSSLGLAMPFQPSMWDEKTIHSVWNNGLEMVKAKLTGRYSEECANTILTRLEKLYSKLNYNTHRKSLAIVLTPDEEKIIYLSFKVKPVVFLSKFVSILDLVANMYQEAEFYYFVLNEESISLYDYNNNQLRKVYENRNETCPVNLFKNAANAIELLNCNYEKPVFVTGRPNRVEAFCNCKAYPKEYFTFLYHSTPFSTEIIQSPVKEITAHWSYWHSKFIRVKILLTQKAGSFISHFDAVFKALNKCADGLLLVDKHLKHQLQKSNKAEGIFKLADEFIQQLEKFLVRGNRIEITDSGLLKDMGGIVLVQGSNKPLPAYRQSTSGGSLY
jgi:hypothetical protein